MATSNYRTIQTNFTEGVQFVKNYIPNATFNNGSVNNWSKFTTTLTSGLPTGTLTLNSAASITTFAPTTTTPISGSTSMQIGSSAAWSAGQGVITDAFTIEREDLGKPLTFSLSFEAITNPLNANWSGILNSQTFAIYLYDETTSTWVQPSGFLGMNQNSGVGQVMGSFQTSVTSGQQYRLAIIALQASSGAITLNVDNVFLGKETSTVGTPVTDFIQFSPTINWASGYTTSGYYRRIGDSIDVSVKISITGAPIANSELLVFLPSGLTIDTTKLVSPAQGNAPVYGDAVGYDDSTTNRYLFRCQYWTTTSVKLFYQSSSTGQETAVSTSVPPTWATNDTINVRFQVPVVGFSSSVQMSNATDTRVIAAQYTNNAGGLLTVDVTNITFNTLGYDTAGSWSGTVFTAPVSGYYQFQGMVNTTVAVNIDLFLWKDGVKTYMTTQNRGVSSSVHGFSGSLYLNAGQTASLRSDTAATLASSATSHYINVNRLSGPSVVAASESVNASYSITAAASTAINVQFNFNNKVFDSHNAVTTGAGAWKFTAPISGKYQVSSSIINGAATNNTMTIFKNGSLYRNMGYNIVNSVTGGSIPGVTIVSLNAGEYIDVRSGSNTVTPIAGAFSGATLSNSNFIDIVRIGN
jgi:hypothetical protein